MKEQGDEGRVRKGRGLSRGPGDVEGVGVGGVEADDRPQWIRKDRNQTRSGQRVSNSAHTLLRSILKTTPSRSFTPTF